MTTLYLSLDADGRVNGCGPDPAVFERAFPAPADFDPARHLSTARLVGERLVLAGPPPSVTARQARLALLEAGLLDDIETALQTLPREAQITWEYATEFARDWPLLLAVADALGLSEEALDQLFIRASAL
ncbi:MAG: hypothetical protein LBO79_04410 [Zoogloeaceae bacterium]|jgi:hypothetical protein|nr:hypothetical protein [Zoogloeaceae bacterium]